MSTTGLTSEIALARLAGDGPNQLPSAKAHSIFRQFIDVIREPMLLLLAAAGLINFLLSEVLDASILMLTVLIIVGISLFQERKTERALLTLKELSSPKALVLRDGVEKRIASTEVVREDIIILQEGDRIPADAKLISATNFTVDESMLTGESLSITKEVGQLVFSGTLVVKGHGRAIVEKTGASTEIGKIGKALATIEIERTRLQVEVDRIVRIIAALSIIAAIAVVVVFRVTRGSWLEGALAGIAAAMALLPEEFPVVLTVFLALGAWRMSQERVITRRAPAIETLGSVTVLCVDKTGTLTMNQMSVEEATSETALYGLLASPINPFDPMDKAFHEVAERDSSWNLLREYPISEDLLAITHIWDVPGKDRVIAAKGAPEAIARLCRFSDAQLQSLLADVDMASKKGFRVLGVAKATLASSAQLPDSPTSFTFEFIGLAHLHDPVRPRVAHSVSELRTAGVRTIMLTGDYPGTAIAIAKEIGIDADGGVITGAELEQLDDAQLAQRIKTVSIFARVVPTQKLRLIRALKLDGEVVGMTGDGVNDAPALRAADIGIAMGHRGTDVARESAALIITDDDFTSIAGGIRQGRKIYANLRKAMSYVIAVHIPIFGMALIPVFFKEWPLVLLPAQIAFLELIIDPASSVVFESEDADPNIMKEKPRTVGEKILNAKIVLLAVFQGLFVLAGALSIYLWANLGDKSDELVRSLTFATLMIGNLSLVLVNRSRTLSIFATLRTRKNKSVKWILLAGVGILVAIFNISWLQSAFNLTALNPVQWLLVAGAGFGSVVWFEIYKLLKR